MLERIRNPYAKLLQDFAFSQANILLQLCGITNARYILGGSLGYDAALKGDYDIDLRLLIPDAGKSQDEVRREIDSVKDLLVEQAKGDPTFKVRFIDEGGKNYIWHTKQMVKVPGIPGDPDVELSWNIQAESTYRGIAEVASKLPQEIKDRYVIAKWMAREESDEAYRTLKKKWMVFNEWLIDQKANDMNDKELKKLLEDNSDKIPSFLK